MAKTDTLEAHAQVLDALYAGALDPALWPDAMTGIARHLDGVGTCYASTDPGSGRILESETHGFDPLANELYVRHFATEDVRMPGALRARVGEVVTEQQLLEPRAFRRSRLYNELLLEFDVPYIMTIRTEDSHEASAQFVVERTLAHGPFDGEHVAAFGRLVPHVMRALRVRRVLESARVQRDGALEWLGQQRQAVAFVTRDGAIVGMSTLAHELVARRHFVCAAGTRLVAHHPADAARLARAIATTHGSHGGTSLVLRCPTDGRRAVAHVLPIADGYLPGRGRATAMVVIVDPSGQRTPSAELLRSVLPLTHAEARLAARLYELGSLRACAEALGTSMHTCRTQLRSVYAKTGCRSQAALVRRIADVRGDSGQLPSSPCTRPTPPDTRRGSR